MMIIRLTGALLLIAIAMSACQSQPIDCNVEALQVDLISMRDKEQAIREELMPVMAQYQEDGSGKMKLFTLAMQMEKQDAANQERLQAIFSQCGWPEALNAKAHESIYLILQHSPDSLMRRYFPMVQAYAGKGLLSPDDPATMYDRLQMRAGLPQRYGTQTFPDAQNRNLVWPVEDAERLAEYRDSVGLPSMSAYFDLARDSMGIEMVWDKTLTVEQAAKLKKEGGF
jgi:hypothetical protein